MTFSACLIHLTDAFCEDSGAAPAPSAWRRRSAQGCPCVTVAAPARSFCGLLCVPSDIAFGFLLSLFDVGTPGVAALRARLLAHVEGRVVGGPQGPRQSDVDGVIFFTCSSAQASPARSRLWLRPPSASDGLPVHCAWGQRLCRLARRQATLNTKLYYLSTVGGGWAAVRRADMCLVYAAKQYRIAKRLADELTQARCRLYLGYHQMWTGHHAVAAAIFRHEWRWAHRHRQLVFLRAVESVTQVLRAAQDLQQLPPQASCGGVTGDLPVREADVVQFCDRLCRVGRTLAPTSDHALENDTDSESGSEVGSDADDGGPATSAFPALPEARDSRLQEAWAEVFQGHASTVDPLAA
eukprot:EG_transcript_14539